MINRGKAMSDTRVLEISSCYECRNAQKIPEGEEVVTSNIDEWITHRCAETGENVSKQVFIKRSVQRFEVHPDCPLPKKGDKRNV